jgi:thiol-disulfide isomerase/thioredoxin
MGTAVTVLLAVVVGFLLLMVGFTFYVRARARAQTGKPAPSLPGTLGAQVAKGRRALIYFFSPGCAACRTVTPRIEALRRTNSAVHLVDVSRELETARALQVMATPSFVEIERGTVVGYHVGPAPAEVLERYAA